ncbi:hypothetical protein [Herbidospora daliensis]|uniref:hypothetical protein n=1 Tax=Herbidospora daliensis TaxID=295585 RepID=UPI000784EAC6|nr:hypothetical protein [Herbidospora daliensis]
MNEDTLIKEGLREWAEEVRVPADLAGRALRARRRRLFGFAGPGVVLVAAAVTAVVTLLPGASPERTIVAERPRAAAAPADVRTDTENDPPVNLIAAGPWAVGSYYTTRWVSTDRGTETLRYDWSVYDRGKGRYVRTPYQWVDVLPGMGLAAVLVGDLPSQGLGLVDLETMMYTRWWDLDEAAGSVFWSPDGSKLVLTTYSGPPDEKVSVSRSRTGFYVIDPAGGTMAWRRLPPDPDGVGGREDLRWDDDGVRLWAQKTTGGGRWLYDAEGGHLGADDDPRRMNQAGVSPDGRLRAGPAGLPTEVTDVETGEVVGRQQTLQLWAWVDDDHLIGLGCARACDNEFDNTLVMVSVDGKETTRLASYRDARTSWRPVLVRR